MLHAITEFTREWVIIPDTRPPLGLLEPRRYAEQQAHLVEVSLY